MLAGVNARIEDLQMVKKPGNSALESVTSFLNVCFTSKRFHQKLSVKCQLRKCHKASNTLTPQVILSFPSLGQFRGRIFSLGLTTHRIHTHDKMWADSFNRCYVL